MYRLIIRPLLFALNVEQAHALVVRLLRIVGLIPGGRWLLHKCCAVEHPALEREVFGLHFRNPVGLGAGFDRNGDAFRELAAAGFGFVEIGTVTPRPQSGNPRPRTFRLPADRAVIHRIGLDNRGLDYALKMLRRPHEGMIVGCNIGRNTTTERAQVPNDYLKVFRNLYQYADYFTVNFHCEAGVPEAEIRSEAMRIIQPLFEFRRGQNQYRPILLKISPDIPDTAVDLLTDIMIETPLDGLVATNGSLRRPPMETDADTLKQIGSGRLTGAPLTARAIEVVRRIHQRSQGTYPIIGSGGMMSPADVQAMFDAGASLVQLHTGLIYEGPKLIRDCCRALIPRPEQPAAEAAPAAEPAAEAADTQSETEA